MVRKPTYKELERRVKELEEESIEFRRLGEMQGEREKRFRNFLDNLGDVAYETDRFGNITYANKMTEMNTGVPLKDLIGRAFFPLFIRESQEVAIDAYQRTLNGESPEFELTFTSGRICHFKNEPLRNRDAKIIGVFGIGRDITDRKQREGALQDCERKYEKLIENLPQKIFYKDRNSIYVTCNENYARDFNITPREIAGKTDYDFYPKDLAEKYRADDKRVMGSGAPEEIQEKYIHDGQDSIVQTVKTAVRDEGGNVIGILGIFWDITEQKRSEEALRASEERYRLLTENVADGVGIIQNGKIQFVNPAIRSIFGYNPDQMVDRDPSVLFHDDHKELFKEIIEAAESGIFDKCFQAKSIRKDGQEIWIEGHYNIIEWENRPAVFITVRDITENKRRELALEEEREYAKKEIIKLKTSLKDRYRFGKIVGKSAVMQEVYELILKASASDSNVIIYGESGTGKDLIAQTIHEISDRSDNAFVPVNCGAIPQNLFESEFFGHKKGAFTGACANTNGFFDFAHEGTLFLDEVGELTLQMQVKLLRAIEDRGYTPVGDYQIRKADFRLITATNRNLREMVNKGLMREDFFYRIHIIPISVPSLRDRKEDIPLLVGHFLKLHSNGKKAPTIPGKIMDILCDYDWPGNVRELQNVLERYLVVGNLNFLSPSIVKIIGREDVFGGECSQDSSELNVAVQRFEKAFIAKALDSSGWNRSKTAARLGISRRTLFRKMKDFGSEMPMLGKGWHTRNLCVF
jgi:PAS domain S-box-containing protein